MKAALRTLIQQGLQALHANGTLPEAIVWPDFVVERPKTREHGDFSTNAALLLGKAIRSNPRALAQSLIQALPNSPLIAQITLAGPGFINFHLNASAWQQEMVKVLTQGRAYGRNNNGKGRCVGVEYVSANPTGPLHVGHGRAAALGEGIARLLEASGWNVKREFYYNDAGVQIENLARSVQARARGLQPGDEHWPADAYNGDYVAEVAQAYLQGNTVVLEGHQVTAAKDVENLEAIRQFAVAFLRNEQNQDLAAFGVAFDVYFLESSLYRSGKVEQTVTRLADCGHTYEHEGALWLRSTHFGDDKDRVMRKSDGSFTYFLPDVAYHHDKWQRGYERAITEVGADHHGSITRVRAGLQALDVGIPHGWPEYVLHQMVTVMRGGQEMKLSKRAGSYFTLRDLIEQAGRDATRWFLIARKPDSQLVFDIDLARQQSNDNPVYYVQYAHARICALLRQASTRGYDYVPEDAMAALSNLDDSASVELMRELSRWPELLETASSTLEPHLLAHYLRELAHVFHTWYHQTKVVVDETALRHARLALACATRQVLVNGLELIGVSAPEKM